MKVCSIIKIRWYATKDVPTAKNPKFFDMVEYFFHKSCIACEEKLVQDLTCKKRSNLEDNRALVRGILQMLEDCSHMMSVSFPIKRDSGMYEMIKGYRAQHSAHRLPCKGGSPEIALMHNH
ncbi:glutamate dehydrogenase, mitochondrial-like [Photinus pyralis]|uniref:glutamate dehydrogenase, mitochondrial-like n=1 Tax=Photinus pyralis TaxID=7054 RepID=UPI0012674275|nr:glutamate dehydrogenase, mitochondrial-like [Photinus pyralis]XP_031359355.1 glutamate dehydrogenase, mitochondrial-like [Photinus pyralis]